MKNFESVPHLLQLNHKAIDVYADCQHSQKLGLMFVFASSGFLKRYSSGGLKTLINQLDFIVL